MAVKMLHIPAVVSSPKWGTVGELETEPDIRELVLTEVRLWDPDTERLAYGPNTMVPVDEIDRLVPEAEWRKRHART